LVARLPATKPAPFTIKGAFSEITEAFSERAFLIFAVGGLAAYVHQGMTFSITNYLNLFVWQLTRAQLILYPLVLFASVVLMFVMIGPLHRRFGKAKSAGLAMIVGTAIGITPFALLLLGFWPQPGSAASTGLFYGFVLIANSLGIISLVSATSMIAEIVEAFEERTNRRAEGSFYSGNWLVQKCATGAGIVMSGQIISLSQLATDASPGTVPQGVITDLVIYYCGAMLLLAVIAAWWLARFPISREDHEARVNRLAERRMRENRDAVAAAPDTPFAQEGILPTPQK
ncbi:MAG: sugar transporter, partial [Alphaproteobacteria bacterium HGW-Alphaproteobacteria-15]